MSLSAPGMERAAKRSRSGEYACLCILWYFNATRNVAAGMSLRLCKGHG